MTPYALSAKSDSIPGDKTQARLLLSTRTQRVDFWLGRERAGIKNAPIPGGEGRGEELCASRVDEQQSVMLFGESEDNRKSSRSQAIRAEGVIP
jgi:hypothetical protein